MQLQELPKERKHCEYKQVFVLMLVLKGKQIVSFSFGWIS